jgi:hypothetical protein
MSPAICYSSKKIKKVSVRNGLAHARQQQQFMFSCQNGITIYKQPSTNIKIYTFHTSMSPAICYSKKIKKSVRAERSGARASTTTIYVFLPKRDNNSQATIHKHKNIYFPYLNVPCDFLFKKKKKKEKSLSAERSGTRASTHLFFSCDINIGTFHLADIYAMFSYAWFCFSLHLVFSLKYLVGFLCVASFRSLCSVRGQIWNWSASVSTTIENP